MPSVDGYTNILGDSITALTQRRLEFDNKIRERASSARPAEARSPRCVASAASDPLPGRIGLLPGDASVESAQTTGTLPIEGRVTYMKLQGDQLLHLAEMARLSRASTPEFEGVAAEALEAYLAAQQAASGDGDGNGDGDGDGGGGGSCSDGKQKKSTSSCWVGGGGSLPQLHPLRIELALRISSILLHMLRRPIDAWEAAYPTYLIAAERPARLGPRGLIITQLLRDHVARIDVRGGQEDGGEFDASASGTRTACGASREGWNKWSFLRVPDGYCGKGGVDAAGAMTGSIKLRALARVRQARAATDGVVKVLLGTMEGAAVVHAALKKIFAVYTEKHAPLSWSGFTAICEDFKIAATTPSSPKNALGHTARTVVNQRFETFTSSSTSRPNFNNWSSGGRYLLDATQARIAFVSASTHWSVVASFPQDGPKAPRESAPDGPPCERDPNGNEESYWQDMERVVLSHFTPDGLDLSFPQFVDALARCGLIGFPVAVASATGHQTHLNAGFGNNEAITHKSKQFMFAAERAQALFVMQMRLLDSQHVDATLLRAEAAGQSPGGELGGFSTAGRPTSATSRSPRGTKSKHEKNDILPKRAAGRASDLKVVRPGNPESKPPTLTPIQARSKTINQARPRSMSTRNVLHRSNRSMSETT